VLLLKQRLPPAYLGVFCYSGLHNQRANHLASRRDLPYPSPRGGPLSFVSGCERTNLLIRRIGPRISSIGRGTSAKELGRAITRGLGTSAEPCIVARSSCAYDHAGAVHRARCGAIGLAVFASTAAFASDVSAISCSQIAGFARQVAEQKLKGVTLKDAVRRLRKSFGSRHADTDHELENIVRGIYRIPIFSTVSPEEVGNAYQIACEKGKSRAQITAIIYKERSAGCGVSNRPR
jgi:hypothetical protein